MRLIHMKRLRLVTALAALSGGMVWLVSVPAAYACSCVSPGPFDREVRRADAVFTGTPVASKDSRSLAGRVLGTSSGDTIDWTFAVDTVIKGDVRAEAHVSSSLDGASCGVSFSTGRRYVVFAYSESKGDALSTNLCSRTSRISDDRVFDGEVARGDPPAPAPEGPADYWPWLLVPAAVAAGLGMLLLRLRARRA